MRAFVIIRDTKKKKIKKQTKKMFKQLKQNFYCLLFLNKY